MSKVTPAISVVMSVYNSEKYLAEAIESILNQSFTDFEFIIINDGSTDSSIAIIESYMAKDEHIVLISRENKGLPASLNEGIAIARGKYIARMDADDISLSERFQKQFEFMEANPEVGVCGGWAYLFKETPSKNKTMRHPRDHEELIVRLLFSVCFIHPTVMMRKEVLDELEYVYNIRFTNAQDYELWSRLADKSQFHNIQQPLLYYRVSESGITASVNNDGLNRRYPLVSQVQKQQLAKLGLKLLDEESIMHFRLGLNAEMIFLDESADSIKDYLKKIIMSNRMKGVFSQQKLYDFLSRKYFVFIILSFKRDKKFKHLKIFDLMFLRGALQIVKERLGLV
ncbi:MAG: hypothetical protein COW76_01180 [Shewanella sp. CG18_big_fil_WC_8_21_14_2_50_42_11]|uniref:glycosyltransferase family 2 protein n=1 Tax=Shewanella sp. CG18_big_fil_WC_8_21_14_2_50_42_11 TaxID=1975538 RepID=UPI000C3F633B|nr:glycosyltransferase [Shewanella sp. CG18_big_fil_WC_8_21_14_2_50_42_11]PIQ02243.1 MAG: hypothetical protein COW76_01180 [Shewanella sp. CG18_big_fil_WC_8_21_14_2_50_42_11]